MIKSYKSRYTSFSNTWTVCQITSQPKNQWDASTPFFSAELWMWAWSLPIPILSSWFFFFFPSATNVWAELHCNLLQSGTINVNRCRGLLSQNFSDSHKSKSTDSEKKIFDWKIIISILCQELEFLWLVGYILSYQNSYVRVNIHVHDSDTNK